MTYKLVPRTVELIQQLSETVYESRAETLAACVEALKLKNLRHPKKFLSREAKKSAG
jgi:hypothetical protein